MIGLYFVKSYSSNLNFIIQLLYYIITMLSLKHTFLIIITRINAYWKIGINDSILVYYYYNLFNFI